MAINDYNENNSDDTMRHKIESNTQKKIYTYITQGVTRVTTLNIGLNTLLKKLKSP